MNGEGKAAEEIARTTGKGIDAAREAGGFISKFVAGPLEQGVGIFEDKLKYLRWERQVRLMERAEAFLSKRGLDSPTRPVPLKLAIPLMQEGVLEEDDSLQDRWATLLVNAADKDSGVEVYRSYVDILSQLSPLETKILDTIYELPFEQAQHTGIVTSGLPESAEIARKDGTTAPNTPNPSEDVILAIGNLSRLGCLKPALTIGGGEEFTKVNPTVLGKQFVRACKYQNH